MRVRRVILLMLASRVALADDLADLEARGQELAKASEYSQAIEVFKQADAKQPRAAHACMIGLAYLRRELWPQAELFLARCEQRAVPGDQPPEWIDEAEHTLAAKLSAARIPAVTIAVLPANIGAQVTVSTFAPDEVFAPQTVHLVPGKSVIEVSAPGYVAEKREVDVHPGEPQTVTFTLVKIAAPPPLPPPPAHAPSRPATWVPWVVAGAGVALGGVALAYDEFEVQPAADYLRHAGTAAAFDKLEGDFTSKRLATELMLAGAVVLVGGGVALRYTAFADVHEGGAMVGVAWRQ
jgi:hypothetical protein